MEDLLRPGFGSPRMSLLPHSIGQRKSQGQPRFKEVQSYGKGSRVKFKEDWAQEGMIHWEPFLAIHRKGIITDKVLKRQEENTIKTNMPGLPWWHSG